LPYPQEPPKGPYSEPDPLFILPSNCLKIHRNIVVLLFLCLAIFSLPSVLVLSPYFWCYSNQ